MSAISDALAQTQAALAEVGVALDNIAADEANLAKQIQDLKDQINNSDSVLTPADQEALNTALATAQAMSTKTKGIADSVPDAPPPPPV